MNLQQIKYVLAIYRHGSFTKAAAEMFVSQSSLSQQIQKLEEEIGFPLFDRTTRTLTPTTDGEAFCKQAQRVIGEYDTLNRMVKARKSQALSRLSVLISHEMKSGRIIETLSSFQEQFPDVRMNITNYSDSLLKKAFFDSEWDVAFVGNAFVDETELSDQYCVQQILAEPLVVLVSNDHPLSCREFVTIEDLKDMEMVTGVPGGVIYRNLERLIGFLQCAPIYTDDRDAMAVIIRKGNAIAFGRESLADYYGLTGIPFKPEKMMRSYMIYPKARRGHPALKMLLEAINAQNEGEVQR